MLDTIKNFRELTLSEFALRVDLKNRLTSLLNQQKNYCHQREKLNGSLWAVKVQKKFTPCLLFKTDATV